MQGRPETPPPRRGRGPTTEIPVEDLGALIACSVRYALGRQSYVTGDVAGHVRRYWGRLTPRWRIVVTADLERELARDDRVLPDRQVWVALFRWCSDEERRRTKRKAARASG